MDNGSVVWPFPSEELHRGYVPYHRAWWEHPRANDPGWMAILVYILAHATHRPMQALFEGKVVTLKPGQLITGRLAIAEATGVHKSKVWRVIESMKSEHLIEQQAGAHHSIFTVLCWDLLNRHEHPVEQQLSTKRAQTNTRSQNHPNITTAGAVGLNGGRGKERSNPEVHVFIAGWMEAFSVQFERPYVPNWGRDGKAVKTLLAVTSLPAADLLAVAARAWSTKGFWCERANSIVAFCSRWSEINAELAPPKPRINTSVYLSNSPAIELPTEPPDNIKPRDL